MGIKANTYAFAKSAGRVRSIITCLGGVKGHYFRIIVLGRLAFPEFNGLLMKYIIAWTAPYHYLNCPSLWEDGVIDPAYSLRVTHHAMP